MRDGNRRDGISCVCPRKVFELPMRDGNPKKEDESMNIQTGF